MVYRDDGLVAPPVGSLEALIRSFDWQSTALGQMASWTPRFRATVDMMVENPLPMVMLCGSEGIMLYNDAYAAVAGGRHPRILGSRVEDTWPALAEFNRHVLDVGLSGRPLVFRDQRLVLERRGEPEDAWFDLTYSPLRDEAGRPVAVLAVVIETTRRVRDEQARLAAEAGLRAAQAEERLRHAQKMEAIGQLTSGIAHDFNNLLTGIVGSIELMKTRIARGQIERLPRYADAAMTSARRAASLTHRLLAFARRQPLDPRPVDANRLLRSIEDVLVRTVGEGVRLVIRTEPGLWRTLCDPSQLENVLINLAVNAREAMTGGGVLSIETSNAALDAPQAGNGHELTPGDYVKVEVSDTGSGMTPEVLARAFEPFFTTKDMGQGNGLGLSMVYGFARQSEGAVTIRSAPGQGAAVTLYLPRRSEYEGLPFEPEVGREFDEIDSQHSVVMVVEDDPVVRALVVEVLTDMNCIALEAADGQTGLARMGMGDRIDLLVSDVALPGLNGRIMAEQARVGRPDLKVLFITGYSESAAMASGFLMPGMELLTKPFNVDRLSSRIRQMLGREQLNRN